MWSYPTDLLKSGGGGESGRSAKMAGGEGRTHIVDMTLRLGPAGEETKSELNSARAGNQVCERANPCRAARRRPVAESRSANGPLRPSLRASAKGLTLSLSMTTIPAAPSTLSNSQARSQAES